MGSAGRGRFFCLRVPLPLCHTGGVWEDQVDLNFLHLVWVPDAESQSLTVPEGEAGGLYAEVQDCPTQIHGSEDYGAGSERQVEELHHHGHSHGPTSTFSAGIADIAWMVILGDGIHNFTDGLAIGKGCFKPGLALFLFWDKCVGPGIGQGTKESNSLYRKAKNVDTVWWRES